MTVIDRRSPASARPANGRLRREDVIRRAAADRRLAAINDLELRRYGRALISQHLEVEQRAVLLAAEDVGVARASARHPAVDSKLDRQCRVEFDVVGDLRGIDAEDP